MPVAVAIMTPILPIALLLIQKVTGKTSGDGYTLGEDRKEPLFNVEDASIHSNNSSFSSPVGYQPAPRFPS